MRDRFLLDPSVLFLNHGSFGACPREVLEAQRRWQDAMEANPVAFLGRRSAALLAQARAALADFLGANADDLAFVPNATTGVNIVARSLDLQPGDEILGTDHEYGACDATFRRVCAEQGAVYRSVSIPLPFDRARVALRLMEAITSRTRLIFLSHITSATALIFPVAQVCAQARARGVLTLVDGAHAPGHIPLNLREIDADFYTGNGHKWLCGPKGSAFLHVRRDHHQRLHPLVVSWGQVAEAQPQSAAALAPYTGDQTLQQRLQWQGTRDLSPWLALPTAIEFHRQHLGPAVRQRCHEQAVQVLRTLCQRWGLAPIAPESDMAQMVAIPLPHTDGAALQKRLWEDHRIEIPVIHHLGRAYLRLSVQGYTQPHELQALLGAPALSVAVP